MGLCIDGACRERPQRRHAGGLGVALAAVLLLGVVCSGLVACSLPASPTGATATPEVVVEPTDAPEATATLPPGTTPVTFWEPYALDRPRGILLGEMVREFEAENPDVLVKIVPKGGYEGIHASMLAGTQQVFKRPFGFPGLLPVMGQQSHLLL